MIGLGVVWAIGLAVTVLLVMKQSWPYYAGTGQPDNSL